ncbi:acid protease [Wolfiporia cocos MD-104 SS10]|uniref:Acid protease n=1 Tax=Wolfiporia cocos (strain MD-104) TaxID=742152 RepID=A0A2H3JQB3_WOLCO|nr:acid protease [Wolfiporia cocos MD-104 SS10]
MFPTSETSLRAAVILGLLAASPQGFAISTLKVPLKSTIAPKMANLFNASAPLTNAALKVVATVQAGDNQTFSDVLVDTGSAILWVGGQQKYIPGADTRVINETFSVGYGAGGVNGTAYLDRVTVGEATVSSQIIGSAGYMEGFSLVEPIDGIIGLGPSGSNYGEVSGHNTTRTFVENLVAEGTISHPVFGIYVSPLSESGIPEGTGEITFGGVDQSRISGDITWLPQNDPVDFHWEFNASSFSWGDKVLATGPIYSRTDTGVLPIAVPYDAFFAILDDVPGASLDESSAIAGSITLPANVTVDSLPAMEIGIGNLNFTIPASKYIVPTSLHTTLNITDNLVHTWIMSGGPGAFDLGQKFLENAYSAYDMENHLVGFAYLA